MMKCNKQINTHNDNEKNMEAVWSVGLGALHPARHHVAGPPAPLPRPPHCSVVSSLRGLVFGDLAVRLTSSAPSFVGVERWWALFSFTSRKLACYDGVLVFSFILL
ncbi:uncharacterized protein [Aegilops tauschii subsp. strangulata]|uniref:uncharacterized protein n=1 Tax=Aegilops tauschii subsp. strangulata TaxID=200361 RepID=UPI003CC898B4